MGNFASGEAWIGLITLTFLQIILGVDNIVLLTVLSGRLKKEEQQKARKWGLVVAAVSRLILLVGLLFVAEIVDHPLFQVFSFKLTGKSLILLGGGLFLIYKATTEIHEKLEGQEEAESGKALPSLKAVLGQIFILDIVFSLDSVITALGMVKIMWVQIAAVLIAVLIMLKFIDVLADFVDRHPTIKMLALSFLILIGFNLVAEALSFEIPKGYTYAAMAWSVAVELLNLQYHKRKQAHAHKEPDTAIGEGE